MIHKPLALGADQQGGSAIPVAQITGVRPEIELGQVAVQVGLADGVECPEDTPLQQREVRLNRVGMVEAACFDIFASRVVDGAVSRELLANLRIDLGSRLSSGRTGGWRA